MFDSNACARSGNSNFKCRTGWAHGIMNLLSLHMKNVQTDALPVCLVGDIVPVEQDITNWLPGIHSEFPWWVVSWGRGEGGHDIVWGHEHALSFSCTSKILNLMEPQRVGNSRGKDNRGVKKDKEKQAFLKI